MITMNFNLLLKPGVKNFILSIAIWYLGIFAYMFIHITSMRASLPELLEFYSVYTWPNFLLCYVLVMWVIPRFISRKKYGLLLMVTVLIIGVYIFIRYLNNNYWGGNTYYHYYVNNELRITSVVEIITSEGFLGVEFALIAFAYRMFWDWLIVDRKKRELENEKLVSELALLRYQLNPHFLFNTINDIYYLALIKSNKTADSLLKLSDLLRYVLHEKDDMVMLDKEIQYIRKFIELHHFRFPDDVVDLKIEIGNAGISRQIPPLLLSSFIENAFKHGQPGTPEHPVEISIRVENDILYYSVKNPIKEPVSVDVTSGIGIPNLVKRLSLLYPGKYKLELTKTGADYFSNLELQLNT